MNNTGIWEPNAGVVDEDGNWHPIYSTGHDGIDDGGWFSEKIDQLKQELGYDIRPARTQYEEKVHSAIEEVFGKKWYEIEDGEKAEKDPRVLEKTKAARQNLEEYEFRYRHYREEQARRLNQAFMEAFDREWEEDRPCDLGLIDDGHIKETCANFCKRYDGNVGFMAHVLDGMSKLGYEPWCTCSDCGEQFRPVFDSFSCHIDGNSYTGDGGIGVIMKRIMCEDCMNASECACCHEYDLPNPCAKDKDRDEYSDYDFFASVIRDWIGVCWGCADGLFREYAEKWDEDARQWMNTPLGDKFEEIHDAAVKRFGEDRHALYDMMTHTVEGRKMINQVRDLFEKPIKEYKDFNDCMNLDDMWLDERLAEQDLDQGELPGITDRQEERK